MFLFCLSKAVRREPGHGLFDQLGDIRAVGRDDGLLLQALVEIDVFGLRNGVLQIVVVVVVTAVVVTFVVVAGGSTRNSSKPTVSPLLVAL